MLAVYDVTAEREDNMYPMQLVRASVQVALLALIVACTAPMPSMSPEAAAQSMNAQEREEHRLDQFQAHLMQGYQGTQIVVYTGTLDDEGVSADFVGYATVKRNTVGWEVVDSSSVGGAPAPTFVAYGTDLLPSATLVFGRVFSEKVTAVEATFDTGQVVRFVPTDGVFALVGEQAQTMRELRVFGPADELLQRHQRPSVSNIQQESSS